MKVAIQGQKASFHDIAARKFFNEEIELVPQETFKAAFDCLANGGADRAVIAIENSLFGSINEVYDLLRRYRFWIGGEQYLRIKHNLVGVAPVDLKDIKEVHSHRVALAQCEDFLDTKLAHAERFESHDTASAVMEVKHWNDPARVAIASEEAANIYGLQIIAPEIETHSQNYTRFIVLSRERQDHNGANKTSIILHADDKPGALYRALGFFADKNVNLTKLESRPLIGKAWHYIFYIDFEAGIDDERTKYIFEKLEGDGNKIEVLGSYTAGGHE